VTWLDPFIKAAGPRRLRPAAVIAGFIVVIAGVVLWAVALDQQQYRNRVVWTTTPNAAPAYALKSVGGTTSCKPVAATVSKSTVAGRAWVDPNPISAVAIWEPSGQTRPCAAELTHVDVTTADTLATQIRLGTPINRNLSCTAELIDRGTISFYFSYSGQTPSEVVTLNANCVAGIYAPSRSGRYETDAFKSAVLAIAPPAWRDFFALS
jgi:hypothetical protein